jgi:hypothetical protein
LQLKHLAARREIHLRQSASIVAVEDMAMHVNHLAVLMSLALASPVASNAAVAATPASCDLELTVSLTPDVPNPHDPGFLSSLLSNHPAYQLLLREQRDSSVIGVELTGPEAGCRDVVETMRRDGRVLSVDAA